MIVSSKELHIKRKFNLPSLQKQVKNTIVPASFTLGYLVAEHVNNKLNYSTLKGVMSDGISSAVAISLGSDDLTDLKHILTGFNCNDEELYEDTLHRIDALDIQNLDGFSFLLGYHFGYVPV